MARPAAPQAKGHHVQRLGGAAGEDQFVRCTRTNEAVQRSACGFKGVGGALAQGVHAPVDVGAVLALKVELRLLHGQRRLRGGGVVQVSQFMAVNALRQDGKQRPPLGHGGWAFGLGAGGCGHGWASLGLWAWVCRRSASQPLSSHWASQSLPGRARSSTAWAMPWVMSARALVSSRPRWRA